MANYITKMGWAEGHDVVILVRDSVEVASMTLDEWAGLVPVAFLVEDAGTAGPARGQGGGP